VNVPPHEAPSAWIMQYAARLAPGARVLDLACGSGRHARALAARGCAVDAVDRDAACAAALQALAGVRFICADLESGPWPIETGAYDAVIVCRYLHRPRLAQLAATLRDGGLLLYETFAAGQERYGRPTNPDFLLQPFELARTFCGLLHVLAFEDGVLAGQPPARVQRLAAVRGADRGASLTLPDAV
jgi:SAM-dependent methyltransferase